MRRAAACSLILAAACSKSSAPDVAPAPPLTPAPASAPAPALASAPTPGSASASASVPTPTPAATVRLLDPGRPPLRALRYAFHPDQAERMDVELRTRVSADAGGKHQEVPLAPLELTIALGPRSVSPDGDLTFAWHVVSAATVTPDASAPDPVAEGWSAQLVPVQHLSGTASITSRGLSRGVSIDAGSAGEAGPQAEMVVQVVQMIRDVAAPLPEEPVGKGARWQRIATLDGRNGHATQTDTYTLVDLQPNGGSLDDVLAQTASPQALPSPAGAPGGPPAQMDQLLTSGDAKTRFDLGRVVAQTKLDGTTSMAISAPTSRMSMVMHLGITVRGSLP